MDDQQQAAFPWAPASATGVGSMPGTDPAEVLRVVLGELPGLPFLPELPARGAGADMVGRTAALLVGMPVETGPSGWQLTASQGRDLRRARGFLAHDLDTLEEVAAGYQGPFKIQACGPWTLAASIELASHHPALADPGAARDLAGSLTEGVTAHVAEIAKRLPGAHILIQLDEPALPAVLAGAVPTASGYGRLAPVDASAAQDGIRAVLGAVPESFGIVHCCGRGEHGAPLLLLGAAGARGVSFDLHLVRRPEEDAVAELAEAGLGLLAGAVPAVPAGGGADETYPERLRERATGGSASQVGGAAPDTVPAVVARIAGLWRRLGLPPQWCAERVVLTPACGLAGAPPSYARAALVRCRDAARGLREELES
jgi:hypothetical protein